MSDDHDWRKRMAGKLMGVSPEELDTLLDACVVRLRELKAIIHGGVLSDGTVVPGLKELWARMDRLEALGTGVGFAQSLLDQQEEIEHE